MNVFLHLTDGQVFTSAQECIYNPSDHSECGEYRLTDEAMRWCSEIKIDVLVEHWPDESCKLTFTDETSRLIFCIRWDLTWALPKTNISYDGIGDDGKEIVWPNDSLLRNWFVVNVPFEHFNNRSLKPEVETWLKENARLGWVMQIGSGWRNDGTASFSQNFCRVLFRANRDATLFKVFWGS